MAEIPAWAQALLQHQQAQLDQLNALVQNINQPQAPQDNRPIRAEDIYKFQPSDKADDMSYYFFTERINDMVAQYGEQRVLPSLVSCLDSDRARTWYSSLSDDDKTLLRTSIQGWKIMLKRDFGIQPFRARQIAQRETFSFADGKPVLKYFDQKVACLRLAGQHDEDMQCREIKEGIRNPEFRSQIRLATQGNTFAWLRQELVELEADCRALWIENQQQQIAQLTALMQNIPQIAQSPPPVPALTQQNLRPVRAEECLENDRARTWYTSLSEGDKTLLRTSTEDWKVLLKCDYGIQPFRAK